MFIAYALSVTNIPIIRFFEGYPWRSLAGRLETSNRRRVRFLQQEIGQLDEQIKQGLANKSSHRNIQEKQMKKNLCIHELVYFYPHHQPWRVLPTRLGCVLGSAEEFSGHLYGLDAVTFWPYLEPVLSEKGYAPYVEREKAVLDFLLNMVVLTVVFGLELIYVDILLTSFDPIQACTTLLIIAIIAYALYLLSIQGALNWGHTIRTAFVLYRHHLRESLGLHRPENYYQERILWRRASRFLYDHDLTPGHYIFDYSAQNSTTPPSTTVQQPQDPNG